MLKYNVPMLSQFSLVHKPFIRLLNKNRKVLALYDTGADISVWTVGVSDFLLYFPNAVQTSFVSVVTGFGGSTLPCPVYIIPDMEICKGLSIMNLMVVIMHSSDIATPLILSAGSLWAASPRENYEEGYLELTTTSQILRCKNYTSGSKLTYTQALFQEEAEYPVRFVEYCEEHGLVVSETAQKVISTVPEIMKTEMSEMELIDNYWEMYVNALL